MLHVLTIWHHSAVNIKPLRMLRWTPLEPPQGISLNVHRAPRHDISSPPAPLPVTCDAPSPAAASQGSRMSTTPTAHDPGKSIVNQSVLE